MAVQWSTVLKALPTFLAGLLPGIGVGRMAAGAIAERALGDNLKGVAFDYPAFTKDFNYPMVQGGHTSTVTKNGRMITTKFPSLNEHINRANESAALAQSVAEHNRAIKAGNEKDLEQWWPGEDTEPRLTISPSSSAVEGIRINKDGTVQVKWYKGSKWYTYKAGADAGASSKMAMELLTSPSIGRAVAREGGRPGHRVRCQYAHTDSKDVTANKVKDKNMGWWGEKYYNPNY
ncbi:hypothetical protein [Fibrobacter sp. UWP2]|uniref:hypothetical protein n=1 Tax=Fibrobacter sp. UWP2 TaxID=1896216 RepID=UPI0009183138|nr:hypothetical protein [Fibrobacter sp. UWP2]SHI35452.1 hypothetical protein SAMN05720471_101260 [Fibrobacter sp. UWP2]